MVNLRLAGALLGAALLVGCAGAPQQAGAPSGTPAEPVKTPGAAEPGDFTAGNLRMRAARFADLPSTRDADWDQALKAFRVSCSTMGKYMLWREVCRNAEGIPEGLGRAFFEGNFEPWQVWEKGEAGDFSDRGLMTGYFEPIVRASRTRHGNYQYPIYGVPDDLITVDLSSVYPELKHMRLRGKLEGRKLVPYDDRNGIERRADLREKSVICWADDPVEVFFLQVQGSGRVLLNDGKMLRVGYANQNGHPYRSLGGWLVANAGLTRDEMSMQRIKQWVRDNPHRRRELLGVNPNFVFFQERKGYGDDEGPVGSQGVPLTPQASVAVDKRFWKLGLPFVTQAEQSNPPLAFARPVIAQDTGGAIRGILRFDYFWGLGDAAGDKAGAQKSAARAWVLVPKGQSPAAVLSQGL